MNKSKDGISDFKYTRNDLSRICICRKLWSCYNSANHL